MRAWHAFCGMDSTVKNMVTSLRAVGELQNQAIRDRHWEQLMQATQVKFIMSEDTNLADLLALNLHKFEDEVRNIVDKAAKEQGMEKTLREFEGTWSQMEFEHEIHPRTKVGLLQSSEELIETLEDNQVCYNSVLSILHYRHVFFILLPPSGPTSKHDDVKVCGLFLGRSV